VLLDGSVFFLITRKLKTVVVQATKRASTLRVDPKGNKPSPKVLFRYREQNHHIKNFLKYCRHVKMFAFLVCCVICMLHVLCLIYARCSCERERKRLSFNPKHTHLRSKLRKYTKPVRTRAHEDLENYASSCSILDYVL
jgi:hypothetical protein